MAELGGRDGDGDGKRASCDCSSVSEMVALFISLHHSGLLIFKG